jgi:hypothetical protein
MASGDTVALALIAHHEMPNTPKLPTQPESADPIDMKDVRASSI